MTFTSRSLVHPMVLAFLVLCGTARLSLAQVSPAEILDPQLKALETAHLHQLSAANRDIQKLKFPFRFLLSRYVGLEPKQEIGSDTRGLEFVKFHGHRVLKVSGDYDAAFNAGKLTDNQRASRVVEDVISPLVGVVSRDVPPSNDFSKVGFEIAFHARRREASYDFEGKEMLVLVMDRTDALAYARSQDTSQRQAVLDRSEVYLNGKRYGLMLGDTAPYPVSEEGATRDTVAAKLPSDSPVGAAPANHTEDRQDSTQPAPARPAARIAASAVAATNVAATTVAVSPVPAPVPDPALKAGDREALDKKYSTELEALDKEGLARFHFVDYAAPEFVTFHNQTYLQMTLRNPAVFDRGTSSIYKRAAQTFDLFLAPALKDLLAKVPTDPQIAGLDITVLVEGKSQPAAAPSSEAFEFLCPAQPARRFANAEITNQDLIDQSVVLVNGVRIALALQQVE
jgi:hypothetical protein